MPVVFKHCFAYDRNKMIALKSCLQNQNKSFDEEIGKLVDKLYDEYVPKDVQDFFENL